MPLLVFREEGLTWLLGQFPPLRTAYCGVLCPVEVSGPSGLSSEGAKHAYPGGPEFFCKLHQGHVVIA